MIPSELDIWRAANTVIQKEGVAAWLYAATKSREFQVASDYEAAALWRRIAEAIAKLEDVDVKGPTN